MLVSGLIFKSASAIRHCKIDFHFPFLNRYRLSLHLFDYPNQFIGKALSNSGSFCRVESIYRPWAVFYQRFLSEWGDNARLFCCFWKTGWKVNNFKPQASGKDVIERQRMKACWTKWKLPVTLLWITADNKRGWRHEANNTFFEW